MTEQDILNKIKESADSVEIPEQLKPEQIELKLKDKKEPLKFKWQAMHLVAAAAVLVLMLGVMPIGVTWSGIDSKNADAINEMNGALDEANSTIEEGQQETVIEQADIEKEWHKKQDAGELYQVAKSYEQVSGFLKENAEVYTRYYGVVNESNMEIAEKEMALDTPAQDNGMIQDLVDGVISYESEAKFESTTTTESAAHKLGYSGTNLQMAGVDESDIVKTNGSYIFMVKDGVVQVVKIDDGKMTQVGSISPELESFSDRVIEMYVDNDRLILITQQVKENLEGMETSSMHGGLLPIQGDVAEVCIDYAYNFNMDYNTVLYTYDISNPSNAKQIGKVEQEGSYKTSRKMGDMVYLFTVDTIAVEKSTTINETEEWIELLPKVNGEAVSYDSIYLPEYGYQGLLVSSVSMNNPSEVVDNTLIMNDYVEIYVSSGAMYLYHCDYRLETAHTQIAKFSLKEGNISAVAAATVPGTIQDTFAINEYHGNLRLLTSHWDNTISERTNQLYILDENLKAAGKIENIAEGEDIYAARYFGDLAYFITYRNIDPLFAADLSDIHNPKILGELKITGYSEYLHMWGENKLLGIGYETDEKDGSREGIKLVMFDISNPAELSIIDTIVLKEGDYSPALFNYKCVLADSYTNMIGFVTADYNKEKLIYNMYSFIDGKFVEKLAVENNTLQYQESYRGLWAENYFYIVNPKGIKSFDYTKDYQAVEEFSYF